MRHWLSIYLKGIFMGAADSIPGVSGGTIALITGIYERLLDAIAGIDAGLASSLFGVHTADGRAEVVRQLREMDLGFLLVLGAGIVTALVTMTRLVSYALAEIRVLTFAFFFGLIAASAVVLYKHVSVGTPGRLAAAAIGFVLAFLLSGGASAGFPHSLLITFVVGAVAICAMILPGLSGAFLLLLFGQYNHMSHALHGFIDALAAGDVGRATDLGVTVVTFCAGAAVGLLTISNVISWALDNYRAATLTFLVSLMVGALRLPVEEILDGTSATTSATTWATVVLVAVAGGAAVLLIDYYTDDLEYESESPPPGAPGRAD